MFQELKDLQLNSWHQIPLHTSRDLYWSPSLQGSFGSKRGIITQLGQVVIPPLVSLCVALIKQVLMYIKLMRRVSDICIF